MNKLFLLLLAGICLVIYFGYLGNGFIFDDNILVENNPFIKSARFLPNIFKTGIYEYWTGQQAYDRMYRPLQMFSYYLDYGLWGLNPSGFRLTNLILHLLNSILVFYLIFSIFKDKLLARGASLLFLVHPVQISTVAYISARGDILSGFFILACCILFIRFLSSSNYRLYFLSLLSAFLAFLSRENGLIIIFLLGLIILAAGEKKKFRYLIGFCFLYIVYFGIRFAALGPSGLVTHPAYLTAAAGLVNFGNIILRYILLLLWPVDLRMFHLAALVNKINIAFLCWASAGLLFFLLALARQGKRRWVWFSFFWFLSGMIPVYFCFDAYPAAGKALMAESWLYLPSIGFFTAFSGICLLIKPGRLIIYGCVIILGGLVLANRVYWRDDVAFYERTAYFLAENSFVQRNLALAYIRKGDFSRARQVIEKLQKYYPDSPIVNSLRGQYYLKRGMPVAALSYFQEILIKSFFTNYSVSLCYSSLGDFDKAMQFSQASFNQNAFYLPNIIQLAYLYGQAGQLEQANKYLALAQALDPKNKQPTLK